MKLVFTDPSALSGAVPEAPVTMTYCKRFDLVLECVDENDDAVDVSALGMRQWKACVCADPDSTVVLGEWEIPLPVDNVFTISVGVYWPELFEYLAGRTDKAAMLQLRGYAVDGSESTLEHAITFGILLTASNNTKCPVDLHRALLEELAAAVDKATAGAARVEAAVAMIPDLQSQIDHAVDRAVQAVRAYADNILSGAQDAATQAAASASSAADSVTTLRGLLADGQELMRQAKLITEGTDEQVEPLGLQKSAKGWYEATMHAATH